MRKTGRYLDKFISYLGYVGLGLGIASVIAMALMITIHVILRYVFEVNLKFTDEYGGYLFTVIVFMGLAYCMRQEAHVYADLVVKHFPQRVRAALELVHSLAAIFLMGIYFKYAWRLWTDSVERGTRSVQVTETPMWIPQLFLWVGLSFFILELGARTIKKVIALQKSS
ncbi:MAG: TRAP transporter small permease [Chloroflexi bacterium]|nr:TRAP transporter small permease [Chloroflexota bacterium]